MIVLLDTHVFLWAITGDPRLSARHAEIFLDADNTLHLSTASFWEILIKTGLGKLPLPSPAAAYLAKQLKKNRVGLFPILVSHLAELENLPPLHRDPFDRLLVAQARAEGFPIASADPAIKAYPVPVL